MPSADRPLTIPEELRIMLEFSGIRYGWEPDKDKYHHLVLAVPSTLGIVDAVETIFSVSAHFQGRIDFSQCTCGEKDGLLYLDFPISLEKPLMRESDSSDS